jgi:hypothetical protein
MRSLSVPPGTYYMAIVGSVPRASPIVGRDYVGVVESGGAFSLTPKAFGELLVFNVLVPKHL